MRAIVIPVDESPYVAFVDPGLTDIQSLVGGWIEGLTLGENYAYINEEGKILNLPINPVATSLARQHQAIFLDDYIAGPMVIFGGGDEEGNNTSVSDELVRMLGV